MKPQNRAKEDTNTIYGTYKLVDADKQETHPKARPTVLIDSDDFILDDSCLKTKLAKLWTWKTLTRRLPIVGWLPQYDKRCAVGDLIAGITVGLTVIPHALACANLAGVPLEYGLYSAFLGPIIYMFFGGCKDVSMGPTSIVSLVTYQVIQNRGPQHAILLCFCTGVVQIIMGVLGLGFLTEFISGPVTSGFMSAGALVIITSQIGDLVGIKTSGCTFIDTWKSILENIHGIRLWDSVLGVLCITFLLSMKMATTVKMSASDDHARRITKRTLWILGTSRNTILVLICGVISYIFCLQGSPPFQVVGYVPTGLPILQLPPFGYTKTINDSLVTTEDFGEMLSDLNFGVLIVPLIAMLEEIAVCKTFAKGKTVDATQEMVAIGMCNAVNSFVQAFPGSGGIARGAINNSSGVRTPFGGLYTGLIVILALLFFTPYFYYIPRPVLASVIIAAVLFMIEFRAAHSMWRVKKCDLVVGIFTFVACLVLSLQYGVLLGIAVNLMFIMHQAARPTITMQKLKSHRGVDYLLLAPDRCLVFPSVNYVRNLVIKQSLRQQLPVVMDCSHIYGADFTAATVVQALIRDFAERKQLLLFYNLKPSVSSVFGGLSPQELIVFYRQCEIDELLEKNRF